MSDTPRTDDRAICGSDIAHNNDSAQWVNAPFARQLERELNAAIKRIHILEDAGDILAGHHLLLVKTREEAKEHVSEWLKAMDDKPQPTI